MSVWVPLIDSAAWTGRSPPKPAQKPESERPRFQDDLARIAAEHGTDFASRVAAAYNKVWAA